jgi:short-subunit dehydrogenase
MITGASGGIGAATARELARRGATVVLAARRVAELETLAAEIARRDGQALAVQADVARREDIDRLVQTTIDTYGRVDILINNAGIGAGSSISDSDDAAIQRIVDVNLLAPARCIQAVLPHMRKQGAGVVVNLGSVAGEIATSGLYAATKFGVRGLSDALRIELRSDNIAVVLIEPGFIRTEMTADLRFPMPGPELVARAIADAIQRPRRKIVVPWWYQLLIYAAKLLAWPLDWLLGSSLVQNFQRRRKRTM